jgi:hypothetical protein
MEGRYHTKPGKGLRKSISGLVAETSPLGWDLCVSLSKPPDLLFNALCGTWSPINLPEEYLMTSSSFQGRIKFRLSLILLLVFLLEYLSTSLFVTPSLEQAHSFKGIKLRCSYMERKI